MKDTELGPFENLRLLAAQIPDNIMLLDREERIRFINWTVADLTPEQVLGTLPYDYIPEAYKASTQALYRRALAGETGRISMDYLAADGTTSKFETRAIPLMRGGSIEGAIIVSTDVTERSEAAADRDAFFALSLDLLGVATAKGYFKRINPAFSRTLGWSEAELLSRPLIELVHPEDRARTQLAIDRLLAGEQAIDFENRYAHRDGGYRTIQWRATGVPALGLIYGAGRDVTHHQILEQRLRQSQKMEAVGKLAGGVAHDFNNLLLAMTANADLARGRVTDPEALAYIDDLCATAERAAAVTRQLLAFSRRQPVQLQAVDVNLLVTDLLKMVRRTIPGNVEIHFSPGEQLWVLADKGQIEQVLLNLLVNARDAMPGGGHITIETRAIGAKPASQGPEPQAGPRMSITVRDTGAGIAPEARERVFEPFFTTKPPGHGTGLGLAGAHGIVHQHNGSIHFETAVGAGTTFTVTLPTVRPDTEAAAPERSSAPILGGQETILVAEDEPTVRRVVSRLLESAGYNVILVANGEEAVRRASEEGIALALLDLVMPLKNGARAAAEITRAHPKIRVLFTSGYSDSSLIGEEVDPAKIIGKPYRRDHLLERVRQALDE